ncbi:peptidase domain-containing ABC transporter [Enterococcus faecalis]|nr:peptidase domain-containing ABC transporter [Enterococcus faecalis]
MNNKIKLCNQLTDSECGICCIKMISDYYGAIRPLSFYRDKISIGRDGTSVKQLLKVLADIQLESNLVEVKSTNTIPISKPFVAINEKDNHYVVAINCKNNIKVYDPAKGIYKLEKIEFHDLYPFIIIPTPKDSFKKVHISEHTWKIFSIELKNNRKLLFGLLFTAIFSYIISMSIPLSIQKIIDLYTRTNVLNQYNAKFILTIALLGCIVYYFVLSFNSFFSIKVQIALDKSLNWSLYEKILNVPYYFFESRGAGELLFRINALGSVRDVLSTSIVKVLVEGGMLVFALAYLFYNNIILGLISVLLLVVLSVYMFFLNKKLYLVNQDVTESSSKILLKQIESLNNFLTIKLSGNISYFVTDYQNHYSDFVNKYKKSQNVNLYNNNFISSIALFAPFVILLTCFAFPKIFPISLGSNIAIFYLNGLILNRYVNLFSSVTQFYVIKSILVRINDVLEADNEDVNVNGKIIKNINSINFNNVDFSYTDNSVKILDGVTFTIPVHQTTAIVGATGSGKSTLLKLITGLYSPTDGEIKVNDIPLSKLNLVRYRKLFGIVSQDTKLFNGSIKSNIILNHEEDSKKIETVCEDSQILQDINNMPLGLNTFISDNSSNISGGQRQRISIARALYKKPKVLLLDEATSSLDMITEKKIMNNLEKYTSTKIIIAHRLSTIENADNILFIKDGRIVEQGTHKNLLKNRSFYYKMYTKQLERKN